MPRYLAHLAALPLDDRCPSDARSCKHGGRPPGVSHKIKNCGGSIHAVSKSFHEQIFCIYAAPYSIIRLTSAHKKETERIVPAADTENDAKIPYKHMLRPFLSLAKTTHPFKVSFPNSNHWLFYAISSKQAIFYQISIPLSRICSISHATPSSLLVYGST